MSKKWSDAGCAFQKAADIHIELGNKHEAASNLVDGANCFKKSNPDEAIMAFLRVRFVLLIFL